MIKSMAMAHFIGKMMEHIKANLTIISSMVMVRGNGAMEMFIKVNGFKINKMDKGC